MRIFKALILDFDGVLVDSEGVKTQVFREVFECFPHFIDQMMAFHAAYPSAPRHVKFGHLAELLGRTSDSAFIAELSNNFSRKAVELTVACPAVIGAVEFLKEFSSRVPLYLASATPEPDLLEILRLRGWQNYFVEVFGYPPRPKSDAVRQALAIAGGDRHSVALVGDSPGDFQVACEAGIEFIGRDSGLSFSEPRPPLYPDMSAIAKVVRMRIQS
jgi:phosphoglycolate phosphatase-like HAD superfamily hydrolase